MHVKSSYHEIFVDEAAAHGPCRAQADKTCGVTIFSFSRATTSIKTGTQTSVRRDLSQSEKRNVLFSEQRSDNHCRFSQRHNKYYKLCAIAKTTIGDRQITHRQNGSSLSIDIHLDPFLRIPESVSISTAAVSICISDWFHDRDIG
jgi:hypothetical protein